MEIRMPQLGESVTEGTINRWLVAPGDEVKKYQPIAEVITDKVNAEIPAPADGRILTLDVPEGTTVQVGVRIATMQAAGEEPVAVAAAASAGAAASGAGAAAGAAASGARAGVVGGAPAVATGGQPGGAPAGAAPAARGRYSPAVMRLAQEHGIDLSLVKGTGLGGRITRKDVEAFIAAGGAAAAAPAAPAAAPVPAPAQAGSSAGGVPAAAGTSPAPAQASPVVAASPVQAGPGDRRIPVDPVRRRIAGRMVQSKHEAPHAWTMMQVDVTNLVRLREQVGPQFKREQGISLSYVPFFIKAVVESLKEYPILNSQWAGDEIVIKQEINISIAVATEDALAVPVIKNADRLSIAGLNHAVADLAARARAGKLTLDDVTGGTFTVNNTGAFGSFMSAPIINYPQAAILSFEAITKMPVVLENDAIAIRSMMNICLSLDHRILDGLVCGRFLQAVKRRLESYGPGTINLY
ncbi:dihydrolipoamide acetyltransferase family protein [Symbiobacterium terraclitae]|uniref:dihydrolipoamide acetyltransferase family protein n=1 Tax=Symbiobacterium terraclitae TaxID=557451 RepID=UPI0035B52AFF